METQRHPGPVIDIEEQESGKYLGEGVKYEYAVASMQGWRPEMEDAHIIQPEISFKQSLFAVFDGHGGSAVAEYARDHFGDNFENLGEIIQKTQKDSERTIAIKEWLRRRFLSFDTELIRLDKSGEKSF